MQRGMDLGGLEGEHYQNTLYEILKELIKELRKNEDILGNSGAENLPRHTTESQIQLHSACQQASNRW